MSILLAMSLIMLEKMQSVLLLYFYNGAHIYFISIIILSDAITLTPLAAPDC